MAFTLIELLVVISIITLLIAILLPTLAKAREAAKNGQCLSNQRQLSISMNAYAVEDSDGIYLSSGGYTGGNGAMTNSWYWWTRMSNLGYGRASNDFNSMYMCPSGIDASNGGGYGAHPFSPLASQDPRSAMWVFDSNTKLGTGRTNYGINADFFGNTDAALCSRLPVTTHFGNPAYRGLPVASILHPSELLLTFDGMVAAAKDYTRFSIRHGGEGWMNVSFVDGHAASVPFEQVPDARWMLKDIMANMSPIKQYGFRITDSRIP